MVKWSIALYSLIVLNFRDMEKKNSMLDLLNKKNTANLELADNIAATVHQPFAKNKNITPSPTVVVNDDEPTKRISLNTPISTYIAVKAQSVKKGTTLMQYILDLIEADIKQSKN
jgi:hypothetical protein